ncbi:MAG TPA: hypothetical protein VGW76_04985 [Pyrinomonadaceae bacterium]|jgi:hypothetical protein|nr:hypothetical protein [Pyrinomonadaceae bacterium]
MKPLSPDTTIEAQRVQFELMRGLPGWKRLSLAFELTQATRNLVLADLRGRYPRACDEELRKRFISRVLSREEVIRAYGFDPKLEGY